MSGVYCKCLFDYEASQPDELTIHEGDIIENVDMMDEGWWSGELNGKRGMFPDNFVTKIEKPKSAPPAAKVPPPKPTPPAPKQAAAPAKKRAKCLYEYQAEADDELSIQVGDIVTVLKQGDDGWWQAELNGKKGMVPDNFCELLPDDDAAGSEAPHATDEEDKQESAAAPKKKMGVGLGNIFAGGAPTLKKTGTSFSAKKPEQASTLLPAPALKPVAKPPPASAPAPAAVLPPPKESKPAKPKLDLVRALYDYEPENEDELELRVNDVILVLQRGQEGWFEGERHGKRGWLPDNFVADATDADIATWEASNKQDDTEPGGAPPAAKKEAVLPPVVAKKKEEEPAKAEAEEPKSKPPPPAAAKKPAPPAAAKKPEPKPVEAAKPVPPVAASKPPVPAVKKPAAKEAEPENVDFRNVLKKTQSASDKKDDDPTSEAHTSPSTTALIGLPGPTAPPASAPAATARSGPVADDKAIKELQAALAAATADAAAASKAAKEALQAAKDATSLAESLQTELGKVKKEVAILTTDIDDERKKRAEMQVEIDRLKKKLSTM